MKGKGWKSRKLILALLGAVVPVLNETLGLGLPVEAILTSVASLLSFVLGEAAVDIVRAKRAA